MVLSMLSFYICLIISFVLFCAAFFIAMLFVSEDNVIANIIASSLYVMGFLLLVLGQCLK